MDNSSSILDRLFRRLAGRRAPAHRLRTLSVETLEERVVLAGDLYISEFLASNSGGLRDGDGDSSDWVELYNSGTTATDLSGYYLTDSSNTLTKWAFPAGTTIDPRSTLIVFASDKGASGPPGELHTNYKLSAGGEYLGLVEPDGTTIVHEFAPQFPNQETNVSYGLSMSVSEQVLVDTSTPMRYTVPSSGAADAVWMHSGFNDNGWSVATAGLGYDTSSGDEYTSLIHATVPALTTTAYTRFEFNVSDPASINQLTLKMMYDDGFVAYLNGVLIKAENAPASPAWNSAAGPINRPDPTVLDSFVQYDVSDRINLLTPGVNVLAVHALNQSASSDMLMIPGLVAGSVGINMPLVEGYFAQPTPGAPNGSTQIGIVADTNFSVDRGFYSSPFDVEITTETIGATIVYTIDGSAPQVDANLAIVNGSLYTGPITITGTTNLRAAAFKLGYSSTNVDTQTYFFVDDIVSQTYQSAVNAGLPAFWGSTPADYGMDPDVVGPNDLFNGFYADLIRDSLVSIPSISLTLDSDDFFGANGIYSNPNGQGVDWERATSAELIFPDGSEGFQVDAGLRIHGGASRNLTDKHALRLLFKSEYGDSKLKYPLFGDAGVDEFDTIVLRPHFNDGWGWDGALDDPLFIRDQWFRNTQLAMGHDASRGNLVHLYVNGLYWGLYNPSERPDDSFAAELYGGDKTEYDVVNHNGLHSGSIDAYNTMIADTLAVRFGANEAARTAAYYHLQGKLADGSDDPASEPYLDAVNYIDYMLLNHYGGNNDWPDRNWYTSRRQGPESNGFRFYAWDTEISLALSDRTSLYENNLGKTYGAAEAYGNLIQSEEFRLEFADRIHYHLFNGGALYVNPDNTTYDPLHPGDNVPASRFADLASTVFDPIVAESARWGDQHVSAPRTRDADWQPELDYMLGEYFSSRHSIVLDQWRTAGLYPQTSAPEFLVDQSRQHGGEIEFGSLIGFENPNTGVRGTVYYTTDGSDPRLIGGAVNSASATAYSGGFELPIGVTQIQARLLRDGEWSALTKADFSVAPQDNADFNHDGFIDAADYSVWRDHLNDTGAPGIQGDANYDGVVNNEDYQVWVAQYGATPASQPVSLTSIHSVSAAASPSKRGMVSEAVVRMQSVEATPSAASMQDENNPTDTVATDNAVRNALFGLLVETPSEHTRWQTVSHDGITLSSLPSSSSISAHAIDLLIVSELDRDQDATDCSEDLGARPKEIAYASGQDNDLVFASSELGVALWEWLGNHGRV